MIHVDTQGTAYMHNRVFFIHAAVEELQTTGYLAEQTLQSLSRDEYQLVMERGLSKGNR